MKSFLASSSIISIYILLMVSFFASTTTAENPYQYLKTKYDELPEQGKFATGAVAGFGASRVVIKSAVTVVKVAGAAFVATEALSAAGVLDDIGTFQASDETENLKQRALVMANTFRTGVRNQFNPERLKNLMQTDRSATVGAATGAFVGFIL